MVKEAFYKDKTFESKECGTDLVTETDQKVEKLIFGKLKEKFPTHRYMCRKVREDPTEKTEPEY